MNLLFLPGGHVLNLDALCNVYHNGTEDGEPFITAHFIGGPRLQLKGESAKALLTRLEQLAAGTGARANASDIRYGT